MLRCVLAKEAEVQLVILGGEEAALTVMPTLDDVVRRPGKDETATARHARFNAGATQAEDNAAQGIRVRPRFPSAGKFGYVPGFQGSRSRRLTCGSVQLKAMAASRVIATSAMATPAATVRSTASCSNW